MYRIFLYSMLILIYLGFSKALSPSEAGVVYLQNEKSFSRLTSGEQITAILVDTHYTGFLFKTYYQKYRIISGVNNIQDIIVRASSEFVRKHKAHIGMSLYRKIDQVETTLPLPPGSIYIGNREFGSWKKMKSGRTLWKFYHIYRHYPKYLGWGQFRPDDEFYRALLNHQSKNIPFYGLNGEFGTNGKVTRKNFKDFFNQDRKKRIDFKSLMLNYVKQNY